MYIAIGLFSIVGAAFYLRMKAADAFVGGQVNALQAAMETLGKKAHSPTHARFTHADCPNQAAPAPATGLGTQDEFAV